MKKIWVHNPFIYSKIKLNYFIHKMAGYASITKPGSFAGADIYSKSAGKKYKEALENLKRIPSYNIHRPAKRRFERRQVYVSGPCIQFGLDLADLGKKRSRNNLKQKYVLVLIDMFSRKVWLESTSNKNGPKVSQALERALNRSGCDVKRIQCDRGREFYNKHVDKIVKARGIKLFSTRTRMKCTIAERAIRSLFGKIERYKTHHKTNRFVDRLRHFENLQNTSYNRSIGMTPNEVGPHNTMLVHERLYGSRFPPLYKKARFRVGQLVYGVKSKGVFEKGYEANYDPLPYTVKQILQAPPRRYVCLRGSKTETVYEEELID